MAESKTNAKNRRVNKFKKECANMIKQMQKGNIWDVRFVEVSEAVEEKIDDLIDELVEVEEVIDELVEELTEDLAEVEEQIEELSEAKEEIKVEKKKRGRPPKSVD